MRTNNEPTMTQRVKDQVQAIAVRLDETLNSELDLKEANRHTGYVLLVFPFGEAGTEGCRCDYISNGADRRDVIKVMREMVDYFEASQK